MSRIGRLPITVPAGVTVTIAADNTVTVKGPKGQLSQKVDPEITVTQEGGMLHVARPSDNKNHRALHGLYRSLINNMVVGVTQGFTKGLTMEGVSYRAQLEGTTLVLTVGYSHPVKFEAKDGVSFETPAQNRITVKGIDKQKVGAMAADIRDVRRPYATTMSISAARKASPARSKKGSERLCLQSGIAMKSAGYVTSVSVKRSAARPSVLACAYTAA